LGDVPRIRIHHSDPQQLWELVGQLLEKQRQSVVLTKIVSVARGVLADQHDLANTLLDQLAHLPPDQLDRLAAVIALHEWDRAEGAALVAAVADFLVRVRSVNAARGHLEIKLPIRGKLDQAE